MHPEMIRRASDPPLCPPPQDAPLRPVVLVVTADDDLRAVTARVLEKAGYAVITAPHAGHALLSCMSADRVDLLATELSMDEMSGPALSSRLRRLCPAMRTVYFAKPGTPECEGVLVRPFTRDDLLAGLARAGGRRSTPISAS